MNVKRLKCLVPKRIGARQTVSSHRLCRLYVSMDHVSRNSLLAASAPFIHPSSNVRSCRVTSTLRGCTTNNVHVCHFYVCMNVFLIFFLAFHLMVFPFFFFSSVLLFCLMSISCSLAQFYTCSAEFSPYNTHTASIGRVARAPVERGWFENVPLKFMCEMYMSICVRWQREGVARPKYVGTMVEKFMFAAEK